MPVSVVVGGQYGSEGKGKVAHWLVGETSASAAIRVGGPNSGHTVVTPDGETLVFQLLPTAAIIPGVMCVLPPGAYLDARLLAEEIERASLAKDRLVIDPKAVVISPKNLQREQASGLRETIGSTGSGTGAAVMSRIARSSGVRFAADEPALKPYVAPTSSILRSKLQKDERILVEGTQGFGLSVLHTPHYPYATSRDTTAAGFVAEAGLSPLDVDDVVMVLRAFPIRVGGNSGPLLNEIDWPTVTEESGSQTPIIEHTSVTGRVRRVARFDPEIVKLAIAHNTPTRVVLNHLDQLDSSCRDNKDGSNVTHKFVASVEEALGCQVGYLGYGPAVMNKKLMSS